MDKGDVVQALVEKIVESMSDEDLVQFAEDEFYDYYIRVDDDELDEALDTYNVTY